MPTIRLDKYVADCGLASRREIKQLVKAGRITVDSVPAKSPDMKVCTESSVVSLDGSVLKYAAFHYYMLNKPAGLLSATDDARQKTVLDLFPKEMRSFGLFPVGRLDKDTTGLLLITDDGAFAHKIISPKSGIFKLYEARTELPVNEEDVRAFREGITLADGTSCLPAELEPLPDSRCLVSVMEGKYHQVKRMLASRGKPVLSLKRLEIGGLRLDERLAEGQFRELTEDELCIVMKGK